MRYRRRIRYRSRRSLSHRRKRLRRIRYRRVPRRSKSGNLFMKITIADNFATVPGQNTIYPLQFTPANFQEWANLKDNFESSKFYKLRVRVLPVQNISDNANTDLVPPYCMLPWHMPVPLNASNDFNRFMSVDKAKIFRGTSVGKMTFNLNTIMSIKTDTGVASTTVSWRPRIEHCLTNAGDTAIYSGIIVFQGLGSITQQSHYTIVQDIYVRMINQRTILCS